MSADKGVDDDDDDDNNNNGDGSAEWDLSALVARIPPGLAHTYNLGHLDIQLPGISKLSATKWLMTNVIEKSIEAEATFGIHNERKAVTVIIPSNNLINKFDKI